MRDGHQRRSGATRRRCAGLAGLVAVVAALLPFGASGAADGVWYLDPVFDEVDVTSGVPYRTATDCNGSDVDLALDVYEPAGDAAATRPLFVWIHGGSFAIGSRDGALEAVVGNDWAQRGYVVASISYRLCPTLSGDVINDAYEDAAAAVAWLRAHAADYRIDPERVVVGGASAGAITALQVGYTPDRSAGEGVPSDPSHADAVLSMAGAWLPSVVEPGEPPVLMAHGTSDPLIPFASAEGFCTGAVAAGVDCRFNAYDAGHESLVAHLVDIEARSFAFLYEVLDLDTTVGAPSTTSSTATSTPATSSSTSSVPATSAPAAPPPAAGSAAVGTARPAFTG